MPRIIGGFHRRVVRIGERLGHFEPQQIAVALPQAMGRHLRRVRRHVELFRDGCQWNLRAGQRYLHVLDERLLARFGAYEPRLNASLGLAEELMEMIRRKRSTKLGDWAVRAEASGASDLQHLAKSLLQDVAAVEAAMTEDWSNGPVEGHVNRLKTIKRQMYGRAGMKLLKARVRNKS